MVIQGRIRNLGLSTTRGSARSGVVHPMKRSRGASLRAAVLKERDELAVAVVDGVAHLGADQRGVAEAAINAFHCLLWGVARARAAG